MLIDSERKLKKRKFDHKMNQEILSELIIEYDLPFSIVEWRVFRKYQKKKLMKIVEIFPTEWLNMM